MKIIDVAAMRSLESRAIASGVSGYELMLRAGRGAAAAIGAFARRNGCRRIAVLAGRGNNGGDALVVAAELDLPVVVYAVSPLCELRGEAREAAADLPGSILVAVKESLSDSDFLPGDLIVDGLLGTGFSGDLRPQFRNWIETANRSGLPVVALDLPSGIDADSGAAASGISIRATLTITFGCPKIGHFRGDGAAASGRLRLVDIGVGEPSEAFGDGYFAADAMRHLPHLEFDTFKNRRGRLLVAAGCADYSGAAVLSATAALRTGAGIVRMAVPARPYAAVPAALIVHVTAGSGGAFSEASLPEMRELLAASDAAAGGPGWGNASGAGALLSLLLEFPGALLLDADALNAAAREPERWRRREKLVITPHPGEAKRLAAAFDVPESDDRTAFALALAAKLGAVTVLKGAHTVVASPDGRWSINSSGCPALATAGSGDVLSGILGALLAGHPEACFEMAQLGVFLHGLAGEMGGVGLIADDLPLLTAEAVEALSRRTPSC